jgi:pyridoxine 4-dehydrogenase
MNDDTYPLAGRHVNRVGYGAMQLPGPGVFGPPRDRQHALDVLRYAGPAGSTRSSWLRELTPSLVNTLLR